MKSTNELHLVAYEEYLYLDQLSQEECMSAFSEHCQLITFNYSLFERLLQLSGPAKMPNLNLVAAGYWV